MTRMAYVACLSLHHLSPRLGYLLKRSFTWKYFWSNFSNYFLFYCFYSSPHTHLPYISLGVCGCVRCPYMGISKHNMSELHQTFCAWFQCSLLLPAAGIAIIYYVLLVFGMPSYFPVMGSMAAWCYCTEESSLKCQALCTVLIASCPKSRQVPRIDEFFMQWVSGTEYAIYRCLV